MMPELSPAALAAVEIDPELMALALGNIADRPPPRRSAGIAAVLDAAASAYADWAGIEAPPGEDAMDADDLATISALTLRIAALSELIEAGRVATRPKGKFSHEAIVAAASTCRLVERGGAPAFQLLDFLAHAERAEAELS